MPTSPDRKTIKGRIADYVHQHVGLEWLVLRAFALIPFAIGFWLASLYFESSTLWRIGAAIAAPFAFFAFLPLLLMLALSVWRGGNR